MSRCYACCQENCGYYRCSCDCHEHEPVPLPVLPAPITSPSNRTRVITLLRSKVARVMTTAEIAGALGEKPGNISSLLRRMTDSREIIRVKGFGPRGGYGYLMKCERIHSS